MFGFLIFFCFNFFFFGNCVVPTDDMLDEALAEGVQCHDEGDESLEANTSYSLESFMRNKCVLG